MDIYVQKDGQRQGPFPEAKIRQGIDAGEFHFADLAWTQGKASWQPLSALINLDVNQPPPLTDGDESANVTNVSGVGFTTQTTIEPTVAPSVSSPFPVETKFKETVLYQDDDALSSSALNQASPLGLPMVTVTRTGLKVNNDIHSLNGVLQVSLRTPLRYPTSDFSRMPLWEKIYSWMFFGPMILATSYIFILCLYDVATGNRDKFSVWTSVIGVAIIIGIFIGINQKKEKRFHVAEITLVRAAETKAVRIGSFYQRPHAFAVSSNSGTKGDDDTAHSPEVLYKQGVARVNRITEAIATAILRSSA